MLWRGHWPQRIRRKPVGFDLAHDPVALANADQLALLGDRSHHGGVIRIKSGRSGERGMVNSDAYPSCRFIATPPDILEAGR